MRNDTAGATANGRGRTGTALAGAAAAVSANAAPGTALAGAPPSAAGGTGSSSLDATGASSDAIAAAAEAETSAAAAGEPSAIAASLQSTGATPPQRGARGSATASTSQAAGAQHEASLTAIAGLAGSDTTSGSGGTGAPATADHTAAGAPGSDRRTPTAGDTGGVVTGTPGETQPAVLAVPGENTAAGSLAALAETGTGQDRATSAGGPPLSYGVGLQQTIEAVHATVELAARQGLAQARIALEPEDLGEIRIHLTQTSAGLLARVTAESPAAAQALAAGHAELRQSLDAIGLSLAQLDIGQHNQAAANDSQHGANSEQQSARGNATATANRSIGSVDHNDPEAGPTAAAQAPNAPTRGGALVDVLV